MDPLIHKEPELKVTAFFLKRPTVVLLATILILVMGIAISRTMRRQGYPTVNFDIMRIQTEYPGVSPEDVEINVTNKIEDELAEVEDVEDIESVSMENLSLVFVFIDPDAPDIDQVKDNIRSAVNQINDFPEELSQNPEVTEIRSTNVPVIEVGISGNIPERDLRRYVQDLEKDLQSIEGVGQIERIGYRKREIKIKASRRSLERNYVSVNEVISAIQAQNVRSSAGNLESYTTEKSVITFSEFEDPEDVRDVVIRSNFSGEKVLIRDVAQVESSFEDYQVKPRTNGVDGISLLIRSQSRADILDLAANIREKVSEFQKTLPEGTEAVICYDYSIYTRSLLRIVTINGLIGFCLVLLVLFLFLDYRSAFWTAFGIPFSICAAFIFFPIFDITINIIMLMCLVLTIGMMVDDAIVISENIYRHREMGKGVFEAALKGIREVFWPVLTTIMTSIIAFAPMFFMEGVTGKFVKSIPLVVGLCLVFSFLEAVTLLPAHLQSKKMQRPKEQHWIDVLRLRYRKILRICLNQKKWVILSFISLLLFSGFVLQRYTKFVLFDYSDVDTFHVLVELPKGTSFEQTGKKMKEVEEVIKRLPQEALQSFTTRIGNHDTNIYGASAGFSDNWGLVNIYLQPASKRAFRSEELMERVKKDLEGLEGYSLLEVQKFYDGPPVGKPITLSIISDQDERRDQFEKEIVAFLKDVPGVFGVDSDHKIGKNELRLIPNKIQMARLGITSQDVATTLRVALDGQVVTDLRREGEEIDFRVQLAEFQGTQGDIKQLRSLNVRNKVGKLIPLRTFTKIEDKPGIDRITHFDGDRSVTIVGEVDTEIITSREVNDMIRKEFNDAILKTPGVRWEFGGQEKKTQESFDSLYIALVIALCCIYAILVVLFSSFSQPLLVMLAIPFGFIGVIFAFQVHGLALSFLALIGTLGLTGVVVNDSLVMISHINAVRDERAQTGKPFDVEVIIDAAVTRFRPVLLTTLTTFVGLLPTVYGIGGSEPFIVPMVLSMAYGLLFATFITLLLIPVFYAVRESILS